MAIEKKGTPEKIKSTIVSSEIFEQIWAKLKNNPIRCGSCGGLIATGTQEGKLTLKKGDLAAIVDFHSGGSIDIECPRCKSINQLQF